MLKIGVTGSIGSGKTTVCQIFETLGIPVYYADNRGRYLLQNNEKVKAQVLDAFGTGVHGAGHIIDRTLLADIVFNDPAKLTILEKIIHPAVFDDFNNWAASKKSPYIIKEAALLFEAGTYSELDKIITVAAPFETRLERVLKRSKITEEQIRARESRQWPEEKKIEMADFVIYNNERQLLMPQVLELHKVFLSL
jgi:dephospho-CoA kinase